MKKGFTLIEILAVVTLMGLIFILVIPKIANSLKNKKLDIDKTTSNMIISAAKLYVSNNKDNFDQDNENTYCLSINQLVKKQYLGNEVKNVTDNINITNTMSVKITYDNGFKYELVNKKDCIVVKNVPKTFEYLLSKANGASITNYRDGDINQMYTFSHSSTEQTDSLTDYRYIGDDPNNYVTFNGNELWRIIGVFDVEDGNGNREKRIKIVRNGSLSNNMEWDQSLENEWSTATLNTYLNGEYYNGLDVESKNMIADTKYYLGGLQFDEITHLGTAEDMYSYERGTAVFSGRSTSWTGKIALMYPSDHTYTYALGVNNICYTDIFMCSSDGDPTNGWLYNIEENDHWLLTPFSEAQYEVVSGDRENIINASFVEYPMAIYPTLYLKSSVKIDSGDGTYQNPYKLKL